MQASHVSGMNPLWCVPFCRIVGYLYLLRDIMGGEGGCEKQSEVSECACMPPPDSGGHQPAVYNRAKPILNGLSVQTPASAQAGGMWASRSMKKP